MFSYPNKAEVYSFMKKEGKGIPEDNLTRRDYYTCTRAPRDTNKCGVRMTAHSVERTPWE